MKFTHEQIAFVAEQILNAAFDRIESTLPDTLGIAYYKANRACLETIQNATMDTAAMALAILFAQTTGEGMGCWDWAGSTEFRKAVDAFVAERTSPEWTGLKVGDKCHPDAGPFAKQYADEWASVNAPCQQCGRTDLPLHTDYLCPECSPKGE